MTIFFLSSLSLQASKKLVQIIGDHVILLEKEDLFRISQQQIPVSDLQDFLLCSIYIDIVKNFIELTRLIKIYSGQDAISKMLKILNWSSP